LGRKKTLNAKNLEALGAERLAELLIEISAGSAAAKRRLRLGADMKSRAPCRIENGNVTVTGSLRSSR